jgi:hypothetical protein
MTLAVPCNPSQGLPHGGCASRAQGDGTLPPVARGRGVIHGRGPTGPQVQDRVPPCPLLGHRRQVGESLGTLW